MNRHTVRQRVAAVGLAALMSLSWMPPLPAFADDTATEPSPVSIPVGEATTETAGTEKGPLESATPESGVTLSEQAQHFIDAVNALDRESILSHVNAWALASRASLVREADGREWITKEHAVFYLFKHEWMNVISMFKESGICFYANIASPAILDKGIIKYIDYDLDLKLLPDGKEKVLDVEEYAQNAKSYGYDEDLMRAIKRSFRKTEKLQTRAISVMSTIGSPKRMSGLSDP